MLTRRSFRKIIFVLALTGILFPMAGDIKAWAVSIDDARAVAENFLKYVGSSKEIRGIDEIRNNAVDPQAEKVTAAYLCRLIDGGYILIAASEELTPIKAYSLKGDFDTLPPPVREYLLMETEYNIRTLPDLKRSPLSTVTTVNQQRWDFLLHPENYRSALTYTPGNPLLTTAWNQDSPYNKFLPEVDGETVLVGCVNVAMGQLMKYHGHPAKSSGIASYDWEWADGQFQPLKAILYHPIYWDFMPDVLDATTPENQVDAVARLIYDLGVANHTSFGVNSSGAAINLAAMMESYGYTRNIQTMGNSDPATFYGTIQSEIAQLRPVLIHFPGHVGVADGYDTDAAGNWIHINFGWGGHEDDFYYWDPATVAGGYQFSPQLTIDYNIKPCNGEDCAENLETQDGLTDSTINARFDYALDADRYELYLSGTTNISGAIPGYSGQPFYLSLFDADSNLIDTKDAPLVFEGLPAGKYLLKASLHGEDLYYYEWDSEFQDYIIDISTTSLTEQEKADIDAGLDRAPVILNEFEDRVAVAGASQPILLFVDARDQNNDPVTVSATTTGSEVVQVDFLDGILSLMPGAGAAGTAAKIFVTASAGGKSTEGSFIVLVTDEAVGFGKEFEVSGIFEDRADFNTHKVILDGGCIISGYNPSSQGFFSSVLDSDSNEYLSASNITIDHTFAQGIYFLGASLEKIEGDSILYFDYKPTDNPNNDAYSLTVSCPDAEDSIETIATILGVDLSGTDYLAGDIDNSGGISLADAILAMQILTGLPDTPQRPYNGNEMSQDGRVGMAEAVYILQVISGVRP